MNIDKMIKKLDEFFALSQKKQDVKKKKLLKITEKLNEKKSKIQKEIKNATNKHEKEKLKEELMAVKQLIKKVSKD